jgi:cytochrome P450
MQAWTRLAFLEIFVNSVEAEELAAAAERSTLELMRHLDTLILKARQMLDPVKPKPPRNLLEALVQVPLNPADQPNPERHISLLLAEFTAGAVETVNAALANVVDYLLDHRDDVVDAIQQHTAQVTDELGALIASMSDQDVDILIMEILRLNPMGPLSFRVCAEPTTIGGDAVAPKTIVCLVPAAAMIDPRVFPDPEKIRFNRAAADYLHFGTGPHQCAGQKIVDPINFHIALPILRAMFRGITGLPQLRRAAGPTGKKTQVFPLLADGLTVRFRPHAPPAS